MSLVLEGSLYIAMPFPESVVNGAMLAELISFVRLKLETICGASLCIYSVEIFNLPC